MEEKSQSKQRWLIPALLAVVILLLVAVLVFVMTRSGGEDISDNGMPKLAYAEGVVGVDQDSLQQAVNEMYAKAAEGNFVTEYRNDATSTDGQTFDCYIGNSSLNNYDMYIQIFADDALSDQLYLSGLLRPGTVFKEVTLDQTLEAGTHRVYVVFTQVEEDLKTIHGQVTLTMDFTVTN